ncbi:UDP-4-amino-4,6-dideoxy-N-acetyl-beta-L-altrosamine N-acetyltransferase [Calditrichota bacterium GD2]
MKLKFKKISEKDLEKIMNWRMKPEITKYMYTDPDLNIEKQLKWYKNHVIDNDREKYWLINVDGIDIGLVALTDIDKVNSRCYWAYYIGEFDYLGKGIGKQVELNVLTYVFDILNMNKLCCEVFTFNKKVIKLHEKFGSKVEGTLRQHIKKNNKYYDIVTMGILKEEWENIKNNFEINLAEIEEY